ncbi:hypothetical protein SFC79_10500 [Nocardioides sp. S-58]|uniref:Integral membrane protein n=1 Tax=Nocardioides renjunii TaxID=3095075 RepID=A0ABU5KBG7_9ACTN|nr:hypothetical protein [Nocardioides sp. S-58]MDZ5662194.1 hypothetical protein [Nocardioides sp. S-58]
MSQLSTPNAPTVPTRTEPPSETPAGPSRGRSVAAFVCLLLAALLTTPAAVAYWGQRTLNDTDRYVSTVDPLVASPEVQDVIATKVTDAIENQVDIEAVLDEVFAGVITDRPRLEQLVGPLAAAINGLIDREVRAFIASDQFADLWVQVNIRAQQALQRVLTGEGSGAVTVQGDQLVLDVDAVITAVKGRLVDRGLTLVENLPVPATDRQVVLLQSEGLAQLRTIYAFSNPIAIWMLPVVAALYVLAFVLARRRPRMGVLIGAALVANAVLVALALAIGRQLFVNQLSGTVFGPASRVFYDTLLAYLERGQDVVLALGLTLVVAGCFAGTNAYGTAVRTRLASALEGTGARLGGDSVGATGRWVAGNRAWLRVLVVLAGGVVLLWGNQVSMERFWWSLATVVAGLVALQVLVGAGEEATAVDTRHRGDAIPVEAT